ncbi:hypothetical protein BX600DRAFT_507909 [Xylariales sp. PMI_506]|nr:hypothetical protein BX600DRAFT_507909 [Xylariales sp. PMI_506]
MSGNLTSTGRGGAGNIADASKSPRIGPKDLETPTLKTAVVTTGRGGSGNMAKNKDPAETRALQDVNPVTRRPSEGATHFGRGGAANIAKLSPEDAEKAKKAESAIEEEPATKQEAKDGPKNSGLAAKGKEWLASLGKKP